MWGLGFGLSGFQGSAWEMLRVYRFRLGCVCFGGHGRPIFPCRFRASVVRGVRFSGLSCSFEDMGGKTAWDQSGSGRVLSGCEGSGLLSEIVVVVVVAAAVGVGVGVVVVVVVVVVPI